MKHTRTAARRERIRLQQYAARTKDIPKSPRMEAKARRREECLDQIALDKLEGLESGRIVRERQREKRRKAAERAAAEPAPPVAQPVRRKRRMGPRRVETYRGLKHNLMRGKRRSLVLRAERRRSGETRSEADRRRHAAAASR